MVNQLCLQAVAVCGLMLGLAAAAMADGQPAHLRGNDVVRARLIVQRRSPVSGAATSVTVELTPAAGWHLYGPEHGDAGAPPEIAWTLPRGVHAGAIVFPPSRAVVTHGLTTFVYDGRTALIVPLTIAKSAASSAAPIRADVSWVVCSNVCVPGHATLHATVAVAPRR